MLHLWTWHNSHSAIHKTKIFIDGSCKRRRYCTTPWIYTNSIIGGIKNRFVLIWNYITWRWLFLLMIDVWNAEMGMNWVCGKRRWNEFEKMFVWEIRYYYKYFDVYFMIKHFITLSKITLEKIEMSSNHTEWWALGNLNLFQPKSTHHQVLKVGKTGQFRNSPKSINLISIQIHQCKNLISFKTYQSQ